MWAEPMAKSRRSAAAPKRHSRYTPPEQSEIREVVLADLLPHLHTAQRSLVFDAESPNARAVWCAGNLDLLNRGPRVAIVGTRNVSGDGAKRARKLAKELVEKNVVVVSGLAKGVDTEALTAAINAFGSVIAVIGTPLTEAYPIENAKLQETIARDHLLISQFQQGTRTFKGHFPERNRLMAAISDVTVIIEAGDTSGTLHQAAECVRLGRWLFIAKNVIDDPSLKWPANFVDYPNVRTLSATSDILNTLNI
jgi:DNA processing protein